MTLKQIAMGRYCKSLKQIGIYDYMGTKSKSLKKYVWLYTDTHYCELLTVLA